MTEQSENTLFDHLSPEKKEILAPFLQQLSAQSTEQSTFQMLPLLMEMQKKMQKRSLSFTKEETSFLLSQLEKRQMNPQEQMAFQLIKQMLQ